jgi:hypothetical protein
VPAAVAIPAIIGAAGSIGSSLIGSSASKSAGNTLSQTGQAVAGSLDKATAGAINSGYQGMEGANKSLTSYAGAANGVLGNVYDNLNGTIAPYLQAGQQGINSLSEALAPGGSLTQQFSFNPSDMESDPGYQFTLNEGLKALTNSASARGLVSSGATMKGLEGYAQGLAGTQFQNSYNRALNTFQTNHNNTLGALTTLANFGQNANSQAIGIGQNYGNQTSANDMSLGNGLANVSMNGSQYVGNVGLQGAEAAGNARMGAANGAAAGTMGSANALAGGVAGFTNAAMTGANAFFNGGKSMPSPVKATTLGQGINLPPATAAALAG